MLCTFIIEKYALANSILVANALDNLFTPLVDYGWASAGVYCFWDPATYEILYVGLALDLAHRFRQHNGLVSTKPDNCKHSQISNWFDKHNEIGYSILVQSSLSQPSCRNFNLRFDLSKGEMEKQYDELVRQGHEAIVSTEGLLIAAHKKAKGKNPLWNNVGGSKLGAKKATHRHINLLRIFSGELDDWMTARSSIIQLSQNATYEKWEHFLHGVRLRAIITQTSFQKAWLSMTNPNNIKEEVVSNEYIPNIWVS